MQIIFGHAVTDEMREKYTILELDTVRPGGLANVPVTAYAVIEHVNILEMSTLKNSVELHGKLIENYKKRNWKFCEDALEHLENKFNGEINSFYAEIRSRIAKYKQQDPGPEWDGIYEKT